MAHTLDRIRISYMQHRETGLLCAFSDDLRGLEVFGRTPAQLMEKTLRACEDLVEAQTGERHCFRWEGDVDAPASEYVSPKPELGELVPC